MVGRLYKFITDLSALESILNGSVKFTPIRELNDPSEMSPTFVADEVLASIDRLRRDGYTKQEFVHLRRLGQAFQQLAPRFRAFPLPKSAVEATAIIRFPFYDSVSTLERLLFQAAAEVSTAIGMFCLSQRYGSLPMWAHYAANAAGAVVEFCDLDEVFAGDDTAIMRQLIPVRYEKERLGVTFEPASYKSLFFDKFQDWSYEQEIRVLLPLAECRQLDSAAGGLYLYDIPPRCISRVILGWRAPNDTEEFVRAAATRSHRSVDVIRARLNRGKVEVDT